MNDRKEMKRERENKRNERFFVISYRNNNNNNNNYKFKQIKLKK